jgi:hypothetical protein
LLIRLLNSKLISKLSAKSLIFLFTTVQIISIVLYFSGFYPQFNLPNILASAINTTLIMIYFLKNTSTINKTDKSALLFLLTFVGWFIAEFLYGYYDGILEIDAYPSVADVFYLLGYLFLFLALGFISKLYKIELGYIISTMVTFSLFVFYVLYISIFIFEIYTFGGDMIDFILLYVYPIFDLFIVVGAVIFYFRGKTISIDKEYNFWIFVATAAFFFFIADLIFGYNDLFNFLEYITQLDILYSVGYLLFGVAFIVNIKYTLKKNSYD